MLLSYGGSTFQLWQPRPLKLQEVPTKFLSWKEQPEARYQRAAVIVTSNKPFGRWREVFGDPVVAAAMIARRMPTQTSSRFFGEPARALRECCEFVCLLRVPCDQLVPIRQRPLSNHCESSEDTTPVCGVGRRLIGNAVLAMSPFPVPVSLEQPPPHEALMGARLNKVSQSPGNVVTTRCHCRQSYDAGQFG